MNAPTSERAVYTAEGVGFRVADREVLRDIRISLRPARIYGLVGPNGSGKSTLLKLLARQQLPSAGGLRLFDRSLEGYGDREFARLVAYMPQFTPAAEGLTVRELAMLGRFPWRGAFGRHDSDDRAKVEVALQQTDLVRLGERLVDSLSGGERQRAWLAMMLAQDTQCLLLDEPTSALDIAHQVDMLALLASLRRSRGACVVVVLHDINMAVRYCDEIFALRDGAIIATGASAAIAEPAILDRIYGLRMGVLPHPGSGSPITYVL